MKPAQAFDFLMKPTLRRVRLMVGRAIVNLVNDATKMQSVQVSLLADEVRPDVERFQNYGFTSHPHPGAEAVALSVAGNRDHVVVVAVDDRRYRLAALQQGEVAIYTDEGDQIVIQRGGTILVKASTKVRIESPMLECTGEIKDRCDSDGKTMEQMRNTYNAHMHPENDSGGPTGAPTVGM